MKNITLTSETVTDYLRHSPLPSLEHNLLVPFFVDTVLKVTILFFKENHR